MSCALRARWLVYSLAWITVAVGMTRAAEPARSAGGQRFALLIGVSSFENLTPLRFAEADVADLSKVLISDCGFDKDNVVLMSGTRATHNLRFLPTAAKIRKELALLTRLCEEEDLLLIAFAGHGVQLKGDSEHYLCPADADLEDKRTLLGVSEVNKALAGCKARVKLLLVDACRDDPRRTETRALAKVGLQSVTRPALPTPPGGVAALYSCSEGERSYEHPKLGHGVFFHFVIEALQGKAADRDGQVEVDDLTKYLKREVRAFVYREFGASQLPEVVNQTRGEISLSSPAAGLMRKAEESYRAKDYDRTIALCTEVIRLSPGNAAAYSQRAQAYSMGRLDTLDRLRATCDRIIADCNEAIRLDSTCAAAYYARAYAYRKNCDWDRAIADYSEAIRLNPKDADAYHDRGLAYQVKGDGDRAIADYTEAIRLNPKDTDAYYERGRAYRMKGEYDRAIADGTKATQLAPEKELYKRTLFLTYEDRGSAFQNKGDWDRAIADYTEGLRLNPKYAVVYNKRGVAYYAKGAYDRAIADYTEAIRFHPNYAIAYNNRGGAYDNKGDYERAIADCNEAIRLDPKNAIAYYHRGYGYKNRGDYERAIADCTEAIRLNPKLAEAYNICGAAYSFKKDWGRAIAYYNEAIRLNPNFAQAYLNRSKAYGDDNPAQAEADRQIYLRLSGKR